VDQQYIYFTLFSSNQIYKYKKDTSTFVDPPLGSIEPSSKLGKFYRPTGLAINSNILYICDTGNHRIQKINSMNSVFLQQWGTEGFTDGLFCYPTSIHYYKDLLYIGDLYYVQIFTSEGIFIQKIGGENHLQRKRKNLGEFDCIFGLCVKNDLLYVSDYGNRRIQIFQQERYPYKLGQKIV